MKGKALGRRYAGSLIALGRKDGQFERYGRELSDARRMLGEPNIWKSFTSPLLPLPAKLKIVDELALRSGWSKTATHFLKLLVEKKRILILPEVVEAYREMADDAAGRARATAESALPLDETALGLLTGKLAAMTGRKVILETGEDADLLGGVRVTVGSKVYDGTVPGQLSRMKDILIKE